MFVPLQKSTPPVILSGAKDLKTEILRLAALAQDDRNGKDLSFRGRLRRPWESVLLVPPTGQKRALRSKPARTSGRQRGAAEERAGASGFLGQGRPRGCLSPLDVSLVPFCTSRKELAPAGAKRSLKYDKGTGDTDSHVAALLGMTEF